MRGKGHARFDRRGRCKKEDEPIDGYHEAAGTEVTGLGNLAEIFGGSVSWIRFSVFDACGIFRRWIVISGKV